jgi:uncharacterized OsmC-like protein
MSNQRDYRVHARSTEVFGRVGCRARPHEIHNDGPVPNGCAGEELTPPEAFLAGVAACGVELIQVLGKQQGYENVHVDAQIHGHIDRDNPVRTDYTVFNAVSLDLRIRGVTHETAFELAEQFKKK